MKDRVGIQTVGYLCALGSAAAIAATFVIRKSISDQVNPATFSVWWYGLAGCYAWFFVLVQGKLPKAVGIRTGWRPTLGLGVFNAAGAILYFTEIDMTNPALVAFFGRLRTIYIVLLGVLILGERLNRKEGLGAGVVILGTLLIVYRGGSVLTTVFWIALIENLLMATSTIMAKYAVQHLAPVVLAGYRGLSISALLFVYALARGQWEWVDGRTLAIMAGGAFIGPFLGHVLNYASLLRVDAGKAAIVTAVQPLFVTLYTVLLFGGWPTPQQVAGGALAVLGAVLVFRGRYGQSVRRGLRRALW